MRQRRIFVTAPQSEVVSPPNVFQIVVIEFPPATNQWLEVETKYNKPFSLCQTKRRYFGPFLWSIVLEMNQLSDFHVDFVKTTPIIWQA
jgi:hypothetical protein